MKNETTNEIDKINIRETGTKAGVLL